MKMVKEDVINTVAGEGVHQRAQHRIPRIFDKPFEIAIRGDGRSRQLEHHQRRQQIRHGVAWKRNRQPEKRAAHQIKGIRPDEIGAEVGVPVPAGFTGADHVMAHLIKRNLLDIVIAVINEHSSVHNQKGQIDNEPQQQRQQKYTGILPSGRLPLYTGSLERIIPGLCGTFLR